MKKATKKKLIKGGLAGALGAAIAGGTAYLLSNKKARQKLGKVLKDIEEVGEEEISKAISTVKKAKRKSTRKINKLIKKSATTKEDTSA